MKRKKEVNIDNQEKVEAPEAAPEPTSQELEPSDAVVSEAVVEDASELMAQEIENLKKELADANAKAAEYLDGWQRSRAEFVNYKKRLERDQVLAGQMAAGNILKRFLDVSDDLDRALKNRPQDGEGAVWSNGIDLVYRKLQDILKAEGLKEIHAEGQFFDPGLHEAISHEESQAHESGQIIGIVQQGYLLGDRVLRPARVRVAR